MAHDDTAVGVVHPKPAGATEVRVSLAEWTVQYVCHQRRGGRDLLPRRQPRAGTPALVRSIIRTDLAADALPTIHDGSMSEDAVELVGEIEDQFESASSASGVFHLTPGMRTCCT